MADKGIVVDDASSGESVACVDLRKQDDASNNRIVQLVTGVTSPATIYSWADTANELREVTLTNTDDIDMDPVGSDIYNNDLDIEDASCFVIYGRLKLLMTSGTLAENSFIKLTPLLFPPTGDIPSMPLPPALIRIIDKSGIVDGTGTVYDGELLNVTGARFHNDAYHCEDTESEATAPFLPLVWPTFGATRVGIHVYANTVMYGTLSLYGIALTGQAADAALTQVHISDHNLSSAAFISRYSSE